MSVVEDKEAIRDVFAAYCFRMDDGDYRGVAELFAEDGEWISSYSHAHGPDEIVAMLSHNIPDPKSGIIRKHFVMNSLIQVDGDTATARASYLVFVGEGQGPKPIVCGCYEDVLIRQKDGWRFKTRRLIHDILGELGLNVR